MTILWAALCAAVGLTTAPTEPLHVIGGDEAGACQWPTTVLMQGCSGTLVHPEIVLYAAHCPGAASARFGTTGSDRVVGIEDCVDAPEYPQLGFDYAYCRLSEPVTDVPIVPVLMGCERDQLEIDQVVTLVGFGNTSNGGGGFGTKRWIEGRVAGFPDAGRKIGIFYDDVETGICNGDSGGSAFLRLDDGSWRLFGIASTVPGSCGGSSQHIPAWNAVAWVEAHSGIDITPCHDADGAWNPSADCTAFPLDPDDGAGLSWAQGCGPGLSSRAVQTCGPPAGEPPDDAPPTLAFVDPAPGVYDGPEYETSIELEVADDWGILDVSLAFDGEEQAVFEAEPYAVETAVFPEGVWELTAVARDWSGNLTEATVTIEVGDVPETGTGGSGGEPPTSTGGTRGDSGTSAGPSGDPDGTSGDDTSDTGTDGEPATGGNDGCGCRSSGPTLGWLWVVLASCTPGRRRRGRRWSRTRVAPAMRPARRSPGTRSRRRGWTRV